VIVSEKWLTMALLCLSGSIIFWLPFLSEIFYVPMQDAFGFSKTQIGLLSGTFGTTSLIAYFPGGWLADRFSNRKLIFIALLIISASGFFFATLPSFEISLLLFGLWGFATAGIFWSAMIRTTRNWASGEEQGRAFGILEGGRNFTDMTTSTIFLLIFAWLGGDAGALPEVIVLCAVLPLVLAVFVWVVMKDDVAPRKEAREKRSTINMAEIIEVLKLPMVWLIAIIIMTAYTGLWGAIFFTPYATEVYELGAVLGGAVGTGKFWLAPIAAIAAGFLADKIGCARTVVGFFVLMTFGFLLFGLVPGASNLVPFMLINVAFIVGAVYALRGIYFSLLEQGGIPVAVTGTATGIVSVIGYTPDIFMPVVGGVILDATPGAGGYQNLFLVTAALSLVGSVAAYVVYRKIQVGRAASSA
jgi:sugar phosphate permease